MVDLFFTITFIFSFLRSFSNVFMAKFDPSRRGLSGLADQTILLGDSPLLSCKRNRNKMKDYMDRRVTSSRGVHHLLVNRSLDFA